MKLGKKILCCFLSGVLVVTMIPLSAVADEPSSEQSSAAAEQKPESAQASEGDKTAEKKENDTKEKKDEESLISKKGKVVKDAAKDKILSILGIPGTPDKLLQMITETGVELFFKHVVDVAFNTNYGSQEDKQTRMLRMMQEMKDQVDRIEKTTDQAFIRAKQASLETPLNAFLRDLSDVKNCCNDLADLYKRAISIEDENQRDEAIEQFKKGNIERLRNLAIKLNNLFDASSSVVQGRSSQDIISIYDQLMAESYNFANGVPYEQRQQFRSSLVSIWIFGALIASVLDHGSTEGFYTSQMNAMYANGKKLNMLVNVSRKLEPEQVEKINDDGTRSVYCYTLGKFVRLVDGNWRNGWKRALREDNLTRHSNKTAGIGTYTEDRVLTPFGNEWEINWNSETCHKAFGENYVTTDNLKAMYTKIPQGMTLYDEFVAHKLATNKDGQQLYNFEKYVKPGMMVGSEKFIHYSTMDTHHFQMDTFAINGGQGTSVVKDNVVFRCKFSTNDDAYGHNPRWGDYEWERLEKYTDPALLFALEYK